MKVSVIGSGYVGLVVGACLSDSGHSVICADVDAAKVRRLNQGEIPIWEPGLEAIVRTNLAAGRLSFTTDVPDAVRRSRVIFIAVSTPPGGGGEADLGNVLDVARVIGASMDGERIVVTKSTVPVGTSELVRTEIEGRSEWPVHICSNPEFLKEGTAVNDFVRPDRVVIGADSEVAVEALRRLYQPFIRTGAPILVMSVASAEIAKYAANAMLATRISFMNSVATLCDAVGADVAEVRAAVGTDRRIGPSFLFPGVGYGGSCFPKDVEALSRTLEEKGIDDSILRGVTQVNERQKRLPLRRLRARYGELEGRRIAVWGLSFKPETDDMREAPSLVTLRGLVEAGARTSAHDPVAMNEARRIFGERPELSFMEDQYQVLDDAEALLIHTEWLPYRSPDFGRMKELMAKPFVIDGRNLYDPGSMAKRGFDYSCVGRLRVAPEVRH